MTDKKQTRFKELVPVKVYLFLGIAGTLGSLGIVPYSLDLMKPAIANGTVSAAGLAASMIVQGLAASWLLTLAGLIMGRRVNLGAPVLEGIMKPAGEKPPFSDFILPVLCGTGIAAVMLFTDLLIIASGVLEVQEQAVQPVWYKGIAASLYGGFVEEYMTRIFVTTAVVWIISLIRRAGGNQPVWVYITGIVSGTLLFAAGHLGAAAGVFESSPALFARTMVLNVLPGLVFGTLYWRRGILSAVVSHLTVDLIIHAAIPALGLF